MKWYYKTVITICYFALLYLFVWIFFILSTDGVDLLKGLFVIGIYLSLGCLFLGGDIITSDKESCRGITKYIRILLRTIFITSVLTAASPLLYWFVDCILVPSIISLYLLHSTFPILIYVSLGLLIVVLVLQILVRYVYRMDMREHPLLRTVHAITLPVYLIYFVITIMLWVIYLIDEVESTQFVIGSFIWSYDDIWVSNFALIVLGVVLLCKIFLNKKAYYSVVPYKKFNFFLRPFYMDNSLFVDYTIKQYFNDELIEIADPNTSQANSGFLGYQLFLSTSKWKREVSYYINRANIVFCCVGLSDGVLWEMFENDTMITKYIFIVKNKSDVNSIVASIHADKQKRSIVYQSLLKLQNIEVDSPYYFVIREDVCYYSSNMEVIKKLMDGCVVSDLKSFNITVTTIADSKKPLCQNINALHVLKDVRRILNMLLGPAALARYLKYITIGLGALLLCILPLLLGVGLIIMGIMCFMSLIWPNIMDGICEFSSITEILMYGCGALCVGCWLVKYAVNVIKEDLLNKE